MHRIVPALAALFVLALVPLTREAERPPNLVVFLTDDLGWGDLGCYGHPRIETPHLDRFATEGMRLTQCYSASGVCSPSRSAILTGRTPYRNGVYRWIPSGSEVHLRTSEVALPTLLREAGYETCHVGKWHLNGKFASDQQPQPSDHGYDHWFATQNNAAPSHANPANFVRNGEPVGRLEGYSASLVVDEAIRWLRSREDDAPFLLSVWTHEPHLPIESDPVLMERYGDLDDEGLRQHHGNITQLDRAFGELMAALDELGLREETVVVFTSDNGPEGNGTKGRTRGSTGGLRGRKRDVYEGGIRVPGIVRWPGVVEPGSVSDVPVIGSDLFPTACAIAGVAPPDDRTIDGVDVTSVFGGGGPVERPVPLYWRCRIARGPKVAMREGDWKLIATEDLSRFELYDIGADPRETTELSAREPERLAAMRDRLELLHLEIETEGPDWWRDPDRAAPLSAGVDETGELDEVRGCNVTAGGLGYEVRAKGEGLALWRLDEPVTGVATYEVEYRSLRDGGTRNAAFAFGELPKNAETVKAGTGMGLGHHLLFRGGWSTRNATGRASAADLEGGETFRVRVTIDVPRRRVRAEIDGADMEIALPERMRELRYVGFYVKETESTFGPLRVVEPGDE